MLYAANLIPISQYHIAFRARTLILTTGMKQWLIKLVILNIFTMNSISIKPAEDMLIVTMIIVL